MALQRVLWEGRDEETAGRASTTESTEKMLIGIADETE